MNTAEETVQAVLEKLRKEEALQTVEFITAYRRESFTNPLKKPVAAVGTYGVSKQVGKKNSGVQFVKEESITVAIDLFMPLAYGGEACAQTLDTIGRCLAANTEDSLCTVKTSAVKYQNNASAFTGRLLFTVTQAGASQQEADARNVVFYVNGRRLYAQSVTIKTETGLYPVECYGESEPYAVINRGRRYTVTIKKSVSADNLSEIFAQGTCTVSINNDAGSVHLYGCTPERMESHMENGLYYMDTIVLFAAKKTTAT